MKRKGCSAIFLQQIKINRTLILLLSSPMPKQIRLLGSGNILYLIFIIHQNIIMLIFCLSIDFYSLFYYFAFLYYFSFLGNQSQGRCSSYFQRYSISILMCLLLCFFSFLAPCSLPIATSILSMSRLLLKTKLNKYTTILSIFHSPCSCASLMADNFQEEYIIQLSFFSVCFAKPTDQYLNQDLFI